MDGYIMDCLARLISQPNGLERVRGFGHNFRMSMDCIGKRELNEFAAHFISKGRE